MTRLSRIPAHSIFLASMWSRLKSIFAKKPQPKVVEQMRRDWDARARENSRHYVATLRENWDDDAFFRSGAIWVLITFSTISPPSVTAVCLPACASSKSAAALGA